MAVGGSALHWGGVTNRFSEEDLTLRSRYGLAVDWPITWTELERFYCEAERRLGVSGEPGPLPEDRRSEPYPMPPMPLVLQPGRAQGVGGEERHPVLGHAAGQEHEAVRRTIRLHALQHLRDLPDRRAVFARLHVQAAPAEEDVRTARPHSHPAVDAGWRWHTGRLGRRGGARAQRRSGRVSREGLRARGRLLLVTASACCSRPRRSFRTVWPTAPVWSVDT